LSFGFRTDAFSSVTGLRFGVEHRQGRPMPALNNFMILAESWMREAASMIEARRQAIDLERLG
jgi:hypothetical protein